MEIPILKEKPRKYAKARLAGLSMKKASIEAGYSPKNTNLMEIENSKSVQLAYKTYKDTYLKEIGLEEQASLLARNARQEKDSGASNNALKQLADRIEPETQIKQETKVLMVFK